MRDIPGNLRGGAGFVLFGTIFILGILLQLQFLSKSIAFSKGIIEAASNVYLPVVIRDILPEQTATPTATQTPTGTSSPTPTSTPTPTVTGTPHTATPTTTGTAFTFTPTATGTITPEPNISVNVTPSDARANQNFTFTIRVKNNGLAPASDASVVDAFPSFIDVSSVTSTKGAASRSSHSISVSIGTIFPGEEVVITIVVKVSSSVTKTETISNVVTLTYDGNKTKTASVNYRVVVTGLPGTGDMSLDWRDSNPRESGWLDNGFVVGLLGIAVIAYGLWARKYGLRNAPIFLVVGLLLSVIGCVSGLSEMNEMQPSRVGQVIIPGTPTQMQPVVSNLGVEATASLMPHLPAWHFSTPEPIPVATLPSYPVPTPVISVTPEEGGESIDTSPVIRIVIPALQVDTEVKYVPYDGDTWLITGLRQEVAWLGSTSWPGLGSNTALAGHVTVRGLGDGPFRNLDQLGVGEYVLLHTEEKVYTYQVRGQQIVGPDDLSVVAPTESSRITLITCVDWDEEEEYYHNRLIVFADLVKAEPLLHTGFRSLP